MGSRSEDPTGHALPEEGRGGPLRDCGELPKEARPLSFPGRKAKAPHTAALQFSFVEDASRDCDRFDFLDRAIRLPLFREDWACAGKWERKNPNTCAFKEIQVCSLRTD